MWMGENVKKKESVKKSEWERMNISFLRNHTHIYTRENCVKKTFICLWELPWNIKAKKAHEMDLQATIEFAVEFYKFYNVDLFQRG